MTDVHEFSRRHSRFTNNRQWVSGTQVDCIIVDIGYYIDTIETEFRTPCLLGLSPDNRLELLEQIVSSCLTHRPIRYIENVAITPDNIINRWGARYKFIPTSFGVETTMQLDFIHQLFNKLCANFDAQTTMNGLILVIEEYASKATIHYFIDYGRRLLYVEYCKFE